MKYVKILGLLAVPPRHDGVRRFGDLCHHGHRWRCRDNWGIHALPEGCHVKLANNIATIECGSTVQGSVTSHGAGVPAAGAIATLEWSGCTNNWHVTTENPAPFR
jgi:hypothetical protein